ncbi:uncharacterized protein PGTG_02971 [Puccinia graminis f. sp. tritici CRL 75-36-700-3]|uniref:Ubiquitin-like domain-containing protein n=1 Tax=Puccinia graminis f. sp. tritici (strain CRL 75-36-700-3 / race SCCL) TaxID=418459 RepID=E3JWV5_PUCGT|nr:uncharacterized protein PGTG_02971 [Puccinia graminis f. sp. tritici CRL 75-36-700-3]EFP76530.2 hypothetical protein PGTG_02971 [Puccinia graminis f. sp. tritici CRL 75-36-700-3]
MTVSINLNSRSKPVKSSEIKLDKFSSFTQVCIKDIKAYIHSTYRLDPSRQRLTTADKKVLDDPQKSLGDYGLKEGDQILFKDLGPQICCLIEVLHLEDNIEMVLTFLIPFQSEYKHFGSDHPPSLTVRPIVDPPALLSIKPDLQYALWRSRQSQSITERELETILVHRFSNATMPFRNIFKNSFHYWVLSGFLLAGPIYGHASSAVKTQGSLLDSSVWLYAWSAVWAFAEISNLLVHLHLRSLRPAGSKKRSLPLGGYGFSLVCCPNYSFETLAWFSYTAMVGFHWAGCLFSLISFIQMALWSAKKLKNYRQEFKGQVPSHWKSIIPFVF